MEAEVFPLDQIAPDSPIPLLTRRKIEGARMLIAYIDLEKGCHVESHRHPSEQMSYLVSGRVLWSLGDAGTDLRKVEAGPGSFVRLPSGTQHGVDALEDSVIIDVLSPPAKMGIDSQAAG